MRTIVNRFIKFFYSSMEIFKESLKDENALRHEFFFSLVLITAGFLIGETSTQKILLILSILLLPVSEILNYSIEAAAKKCYPIIHTYQKKFKI